MKATNLTTEIEQWGNVETAAQKLFGNLRTASKEEASAQTNLEASKENAGEGVTVEISEEAQKKYNEQMNVLNQLKQMQEQNKKASEKQKEEGDELGKIMTIFRRIANGDIVPASDEKKLLEYNKEMYMAAKNIASMKENDDPKKYKSVDEKENKRSQIMEQLKALGGTTGSSQDSLVETIGGEN